MDFIQLNRDNIGAEHVCCAISDKKCREGYELKKDWLREQFDTGYRFCRLDERAKVFIEYGPSEHAWLPAEAENLFNIGCFWVSGKYKKQGWAKQLLAQAESDARAQGRAGLMTAAGRKKFHFMSDGKWFQKQGFAIVDETESGFVLLARMFDKTAELPRFTDAVRTGRCPESEGLAVYYSARCPFTDFHVNTSLVQTAEVLGLPLKRIRLSSADQARNAPSPATVFSLFRDGEFVTTDVGICMENRFRKYFRME